MKLSNIPTKDWLNARVWIQLGEAKEGKPIQYEATVIAVSRSRVLTQPIKASAHTPAKWVRPEVCEALGWNEKESWTKAAAMYPDPCTVGGI